MRSSFIFFFWALSLPLQAALVEIDNYAQQLNAQVPTITTLPSTGPQAPPDPCLLFHQGSFQKQLSSLCQQPIQSQTLCPALKKTGTNYYGPNYYHGHTLPYVTKTCHYKRFASLSLHKKIVDYTQRRWREIRNDPFYARQCCQKEADQEYCLKHFAKIRFFIVTNKGPDTLKAAYQDSGHRIETTESHLFSSLNQEGIDHFLLHELGHACYHGWAERRITDWAEKHCQRTDVGYAQLQRFFNPQMSQCIANRYRQIFINRGNTICPLEWMGEMLADSIFLPSYKDFIYWSRPCLRGKDDDDREHPTPEFIDCAMQFGGAQKVLCPFPQNEISPGIALPQKNEPVTSRNL
jgi:hypothetical protein